MQNDLSITGILTDKSRPIKLLEKKLGKETKKQSKPRIKKVSKKK